MVFVLLSPAKTMAFDRPRPQIKGATPHFQEQAVELANVLKKFSPAKIGTLMDISEKLATLNDARFKGFKAAPTGDDTDLALLAFQGDVYQGLNAKTFTDAQIKTAQNHILMLSGLYGVLQPLDLIQPYRLEMSTGLQVGTSKNLYQFWDDAITDRINALVKKTKSKAIIGCASQEYLSSVKTDDLVVPFIQCDFKEIKNGKPTIVALFAKKARGMMARYIVDNNVTDPAALKKFNASKYKFDKKLSTDTHFVFTR